MPIAKPIKVRPIKNFQMAVLGAAPGGAPTSKQLPKFMQHQTQTNWCWAACGASVGNYYHGPSTYTQCGIAKSCIVGAPDCCSQPAQCNAYGFLDKALQAAKSFDSVNAATASFVVVQSRINADQPVGVRVAWSATTAHFLMITGYDNQKITLQDPWYGESDINYSSFASGYQGGGTWTHTYFTKKQ